MNLSVYCESIMVILCRKRVINFGIKAFMYTKTNFICNKMKEQQNLFIELNIKGVWNQQPKGPCANFRFK